MSVLPRALLRSAWSPNVQIKRFRRVNVQRPRAPHYERAQVLKLIQPMFPPPLEADLPPSEKCKLVEERLIMKYRMENPLEKIFSKELMNWFNHSKMIGICHTSVMAGEDQFQAKVKCYRENIHMKVYSKRVVQMAVTDTNYESIMCLFKSHNCFLFCDELKVGTLLKVLKKIPHLTLLAGIVEGRLMSVSQLEKYSSLDLTSARSQLVSVLNSMGSGVVSQLLAHPTTLVSRLDQVANAKQNTS